MSTTMSTQTATPELRLWILEQAQAGHSPDAVLQAMKQSGWDEEVALVALEQTLEGFLAEQARLQERPPAVPVPEPDLTQSPCALCLPDGQGLSRVDLRGSDTADAPCLLGDRGVE